jgi:hypothetical protein
MNCSLRIPYQETFKTLVAVAQRTVATACVPWRMADILIEPALNFLLCSRHDPEDTHPMPRTVSTLV